jgi:uncharacterized protein (TIGR00255 family)
MTGYGRGGFDIGGEAYCIEVRSLNHRYLDIKLRTPERLNPLENRIRESLKKRLARGSCTVSIHAEAAGDAPLKLNIAAARAYMEAAATLKKETGVGGEVDLPLLMKLRDIFTSDSEAPEIEEAWSALAGGLATALGQVEEWRKKEGMALEADLKEKLKKVEGLVASVQARAPEVIKDYRARLEAEMAKVLERKADPERILQEAAIFAERIDIDEELVRTRSHIEMFAKYLAMGEPVGKRLDFLCQEIFREINTMASKSNDAEMKHLAVEMKNELERIREQVQNIE